MIKPTIGRVVWYWPNGKFEGRQPFSAMIAYVHSDTMVNIGYLDANGISGHATSVPLVQEITKVSPDYRFCEWMPYQKGQAAKTEAIEAKLSEVA